MLPRASLAAAPSAPGTHTGLLPSSVVKLGNRIPASDSRWRNSPEQASFSTSLTPSQRAGLRCTGPASTLRETLTYSGVAVTHLITVLRDRICRDTDSHSPLKPPPEALARENPVARESSVGKSVGRCVPGSWEVGGKVGGALTVREVMS